MGYNSNNNRETMFNKDLTPIYFGSGRVYVSKDAMKDAAVVAALEAMAKRNFEPLPTPQGYWNISDRH
jgi:hypothetical protein